MENSEVLERKIFIIWNMLLSRQTKVNISLLFVGDAIKAQAAHVKMINRKKNLSGMLQFMASVSPCEQFL
jgi:hypothetical protein